jgi:hypothetical protein
MKQITINITTLSEDIRQITNPTEGAQIDMFRLCRDHSNPILLKDKKPVLEITQDELLDVYGKKPKHIFLSCKHVCRIGTYAKRSIPAIIALMLKSAWESYIAERTDYRTGSGNDLVSSLKDPEIVTKYTSGFKPGSNKIFSLLKDCHSSSNHKLTYSKCEFYIGVLQEENTFLGNNEWINEKYPDENITEEMLLQRLTGPQRTAYYRQKERWQLKSGELDDMLLFLERRKRLNQNIEDRYFRTFHKSELEKSKLRYRSEKLGIILKLIPDHPGASYRELARLSEESMWMAEKNRNDLKKKITRSLTYIGDPGIDTTTEPVSRQFKNAYMDACKKLLKKLYFLLHSDTCPKYAELSQQKKVQINELWMELMKGSKEESFSFSQSMLLYSLPDLEQLESLYNRACEILEIEPENFNVGSRLEFMISTGVPLLKIMDFLDNETERLALHLAHLELIQHEYTNEEETQQYREALNDIRVHSEKLTKEIKELKEEVSGLKQKISSNLSKSVRS